MKPYRYSARILLLLLIVLLCKNTANAQKKMLETLRDSLDGAYDMSDFLIDMNGFIPVPYIITEPALGSFGLALAPVFLKKKPPVYDEQGRAVRTPPDMTLAAVAYTANNSWLAGGGRSGSIPSKRLKYKVFGGYGDVNISLYRTLPALGEKEFKFNFNMAFGLVSLAKQLRNPRWQIGSSYMALGSNVAMADDADLPEFVKDKEIKSYIGVLSVFTEFDTRDNTFTPNKGFRIKEQIGWSATALGSDFDYGKFETYVYWYTPLHKKWVSALRFDQQSVAGDPPFYMQPFIEMRGIPLARYQARNEILLETEQRWDFHKRWSVVFFGGAGKAFDDLEAFPDAELVYAGGTGFRYLLARKFGLRTGIDVAHGPEQWAYYIVFGSNWCR